MAQTGTQVVGIQPNAKVTIDSSGDPHPASVNVDNGDVIEFQSDPSTNQQWMVQFQDVDDEDMFPLAVFVPKAGGKTYVVVDYDGGTQIKVTYNVEAFTGGAPKAAGRVLGGKYSITINSGNRDTDDK